MYMRCQGVVVASVNVYLSLWVCVLRGGLGYKKVQQPFFSSWGKSCVRSVGGGQCSTDDNKEILWQHRGHTLHWVCVHVHAFVWDAVCVNSHARLSSEWASFTLFFWMKCLKERVHVWASTVMCECLFPFQHYVPFLSSLDRGCDVNSLLGNTRPRHSAVSSSGIGWRWTVGGNLVTIYNLGSRVLAPPPGVNQPACWSTETLQPVRGRSFGRPCPLLQCRHSLPPKCVAQSQTEKACIYRLFIYLPVIFEQMLVIQSHFQLCVCGGFVGAGGPIWWEQKPVSDVWLSYLNIWITKAHKLGI